MKRYTYLIFCLFFLAVSALVFSAFAYQWPVRNLLLTATFGESRWDHYHSGIDLGGGEQPVFPVEAGEIIYYYEEHEHPDSLPAGYGSFVVMEHEQGIRSVYAHLKPGTLATDSGLVLTDTPIGLIGESGGSFGKHLHLEIIDQDLDQIINPLVPLPGIVDSTNPDIEDIYLIPDSRKAGQEKIRLEKRNVLPAGSYQLLVRTWDLSEYVEYFNPMAPYRITVYINGAEIHTITFESIRFVAGKNCMYESDSIGFESLYEDQWLYRIGIIGLQPGTARLEVIVADLAGNESISVRQIVVPQK